MPLGWKHRRDAFQPDRGYAKEVINLFKGASEETPVKSENTFRNKVFCMSGHKDKGEIISYLREMILAGRINSIYQLELIKQKICGVSRISSPKNKEILAGINKEEINKFRGVNNNAP